MLKLTGETAWMKEILSLFYVPNLRVLTYKSLQRKYILTQSSSGGIRKNNILFKGNLKMTDHKTKQKQKRFTNAYIDEFLGNIRSTGNSSNDSDGERSDDNIDVLID